MKNFLISVPYIYPLCPLSFSHAKMFVVADVLSRYHKFKNSNVIFPVASHYSGNTAQKTAEILADNNVLTRKNILYLYCKIFTTPKYTTNQFSDPIKLLDYYTNEIYWELKNMYVGCDYEHSYSTSHPDFSIFVRAIMERYKLAGVILKNRNNTLALNYDEKNWKKQMFRLLKKVDVQTINHKQDLLSAAYNINSNWSLVRQNGSGVKYDKNWIIDPMFDSELFNIFDLYMIYKDKFDNNIDRNTIFNSLFETLKTGKKSEFRLVNQISRLLPCRIFICEEHLKNWIIKKIYTESLVLHSKYQTRKYLVLGMGMLNGKRMSASRGHSILCRDLINQFGGIKARTIMLLSGGNISKQYSFDQQLIPTVNMLIKNLNDFILYLKLKTQYHKPIASVTNQELIHVKVKIEKHLDEGLFRQALIELISIIPNKYKNVSDKLACEVLLLYYQYLDIFLPGFLNNF